MGKFANILIPFRFLALIGHILITLQGTLFVV